MFLIPSMPAGGPCWTPGYGGCGWGAVAGCGAADEDEAMLSGVPERSSGAAAGGAAVDTSWERDCFLGFFFFKADFLFYMSLQFSQRAVPAAWSSLRPKAEMTFLLTSSWFFNGSKADMLAALTGMACFTVGSAATTLLSRPSPESADRRREL